ncbi:hypothetical protein E4T56_gene3410 [Termitomyces sp. T112]|nr:hypothetical protein E4T56_gene3410 [Termitomyces sp. T112]
MEIRASQTTSWRLAQAFAANAAPHEFQDMVPPYQHVFKDVFSKASFDSLPECKRWDHAIELLPNSAPSSCKVYPLALREQDKLNAFLQENLDSGHIHPSKSPMASLVLNAMTVKNHYPLPLISELINNLWGRRQVKGGLLDQPGIVQVTCHVLWSHQQPGHLPDHDEQHLLDLIAEGIVCMYLNNNLIYTKTLEEHHWITCLILEHLCQHQLYFRLEKCEFEQTWIEYLSLIISHGAAEMDPVKVAGVAEWLEPQNKKEVQVFLGFANFY